MRNIVNNATKFCSKLNDRKTAKDLKQMHIILADLKNLWYGLVRGIRVSYHLSKLQLGIRINMHICLVYGTEVVMF